MSTDRLADEARAARLGRRDAARPQCFLCEKRTPDAIPVRRSFLQAHHIMGRHHDPEATVLLCRACHHKVTEANRSAGASMRPAATVLDAVVSVLRSSGTWMPIVGARFVGLADRLERLIEALDKRFPGWRDLDGAS
jgi:hypothetical protein